METIAFIPEKKENVFFLQSASVGTASLIFLVVVFFFSSIILLLSQPKGELWPAFLCMAGTILLWMILLSHKVNHHSYYRVNPGEVVLKRGHSRRIVKIKDIIHIKILNEEEARGEIMTYHLEELNSRSTLDSIESFRAQRRLGKFIAYFTAPIVFNDEPLPYVSRVGRQREEKFVLLESRSGTRLLLSPKNPDAFVNVVKGFL